MLKRKLGIIFGTMFLFSMISYSLIAAFGRKTTARGEEETILTSFYPVFIITRNLMDGVDGVRVANLTENHTGCLHDYQLTTKDMLLLENAGVLVINGGGMELFIEQAAGKLSGLAVIDSCEGIVLLAGAGHNHEHGEKAGYVHDGGEDGNPEQGDGDGKSEETMQNHNEREDENSLQSNEVEKSANPEQGDEAGKPEEPMQNHNEREDGNPEQGNGVGKSEEPMNHSGGEDENPEQGDTAGKSANPMQDPAEESEENGHVWMDMNRYQMQIHTIADGLCKTFPEQETRIRTNEHSYSEKISTLAAEYETLKTQLSGLEVVTFHDAFVYLCDSFGMEVIHSLDMDADSALSAGELAELTDEIRLHHVRYLLAEKDNGEIAEQVAAETGCHVLYLDPLTSGVSDADAYLEAMRGNLELLKDILP